MSGSALTVPPPRDDDHDDVAWALRAASAQWRREAVQDAIGWVRRAAETAVEVGAIDRAVELSKLAESLSGPQVQAVAPPPPVGARAAPTVEVEVDVEMDDDEVVLLDDVEDIDDVEDVEDVDDVEDGIVFDEPQIAPSVPPAKSSAPPPPSSLPPPAMSSAAAPRRTTTTSRGVDLPPSMRPSPSGLEIEEEELSEEEALEFGELQFEDEVETSRVSVGSAPPSPHAGPVSISSTGALSVDFSTAAEYATSGGRGTSLDEHEQLEKELGVDLSLRGHGAGSASEPRAPSVPQIPFVPERGGPVPMAAPSFEQGFPQRGGSDHEDVREAYDYDMPGSISPVPGRASVRPSSPPGASDRITSARSEPYDLAPSAELPPAAPAPIEPPSRPTTAPPPAMMSEPEERPSQLPPVDEGSLLPAPSARFGSRSVPPPSSIGSRPQTEVLSSAPEPDELDDMFAAISRPPPKPATGVPSVRFTSSGAEAPDLAPAPPGVLSEQAGVLSEQAGALSEQAGALSEQEGPILVDGIDLMEVPGLQDLPDEAARLLAQGAAIRSLGVREEVSAFSVLLVTAGSVQLMPTVADAACAYARRGEVLFTQGTFEDGVAVRVVGAEPGTRVALFDKEMLSAATSDCPWVFDELSEVANKYLAFAGGVLGPLGDSLDDMFRFMVLEKCSVKSKPAGVIIAEAGKPMDGMYILGGGSLEVLAPDGSVKEQLNLGDFVFPETVLSAGPASATVRAGGSGALVLYANRMGAHELLATCPPFIEILAG